MHKKIAIYDRKWYINKCKQNMNKIWTYSSKTQVQNCEIVTKIEKVYNKYKKSVAILSKLLYINKSEND